jgi:large subunit ribosomal protein L13
LIRRTNMSAKRKVVTIDASGRPFGRVASECVRYLLGKDQADYRPNIVADTTVRITHIDKILFTGSKLDQKQYHRYTGYPGGIKTVTLRQAFQKAPTDVFRKAVKQMLPKNRLHGLRMKSLIIT